MSRSKTPQERELQHVHHIANGSGTTGTTGNKLNALVRINNKNWPVRKKTAKQEYTVTTVMEMIPSVHEWNLEVFLSAGVSTFHSHASEAKKLIAKADDALYKAKENGRDCVVNAQPE